MHAPGRPAVVMRIAWAALISASISSLHLVRDSPAAAAEQVDAQAMFRDAGTVRLERGQFDEGEVARSGLLIINPTTRRGYQIFESSREGTTVQSFDLDTLVPIRRTNFRGLPILAGEASGVSAALFAGEVVHAVDEAAGRIYLALGGPVLLTGSGAPDARRNFERLVVIDEARFDKGDARFAKALALPASQARLRAHFLHGIRVTRYGQPPVRTPGSPRALPGKLLALFAGAVPQPPHDHELVQWSPKVADSDFGTAADQSTGLPKEMEEEDTWAHNLTACAPTGLTQSGGGPTLQAAMLATRDAVYVPCHVATYAGAVVRVALRPDPLDSSSTPRMKPAQLGDEEVFLLSQRISETMVDEGGSRLFLRSTTGSGSTWWTFDARRHRYVGSIAGLQNTGFALGAGIDSTTGRLYALTPDHFTQDSKGKLVPVRGGVQFADGRLDPVPPLENARPDLAYTGTFAIRVDPVTKRIFVRRGNDTVRSMVTYPSVRVSTPSSHEPFYRILEDRVPPPQPPQVLDDSVFTTDVPEVAGVTTASFLGSASGYGSRVLLVGGTRALTGGQTLNSPCSTDDRELLIGAVGSVSLSDQSTSAEAAAMDADARTREVFGDPVNRCKPISGNNDPRVNSLDRCSIRSGETQVDTEELAFDRRIVKDGKPVDENGDGCWDRDGVNRYAAQCVTDRSSKAPGATGTAVPRDGFRADVTCAHSDEHAKADSTGSFSSADLVARAGGSPPGVSAPTVRVAYSHSEVKVERRLGKGIEVKVDSIARGIEIDGVGTIGVVRAEATSLATGSRTRGAQGTYTRTICGVNFPSMRTVGCLDEGEQAVFVERLNTVLAGRGRARLRNVEKSLSDGSESGYRAAVQREGNDLFEDRIIEKDNSLAVPGLELTFFQGDGTNGTARQIFHFAGAQTATSYGIACLYGESGGGCLKGDEPGGTVGSDDAEPADAGASTTIVNVDSDDSTTSATASVSAGSGRESRLVRLLKAPFRAAAEVVRLLFNNPRELGLMAAVWALLYLPCWLGERRRSIADLRARRTVDLGGVA